MSDELKPCPFCGGNDLFYRKTIPSMDVGCVKCRFCFATANVRTWNTRTDTIPTWHNLKIRQLNERYAICKKAVDDHDGNIVHAAKSIKIGRRQLYRELARGLLVPTPTP